MSKKLTIIIGIILYGMCNSSAYDITLFDKPSFLIVFAILAAILFQQVYVLLGTSDE